MQPTEEELFQRYNPELQKKSLERRYERQKEFDDYVTKLKEYSKSDKSSTEIVPAQPTTATPIPCDYTARDAAGYALTLCPCSLGRAGGGGAQGEGGEAEGGCCPCRGAEGEAGGYAERDGFMIRRGDTNKEKCMDHCILNGLATIAREGSPLGGMEKAFRRAYLATANFHFYDIKKTLLQDFSSLPHVSCSPS